MQVNEKYRKRDDENMIQSGAVQAFCIQVGTVTSIELLKGGLTDIDHL